MRAAPSLAPIGLIALLAAPAADAASVRRCLSPEGVTIYTDKRCDYFHALELPLRSRPGGSAPAIGARPVGNAFGAQGPLGSARPLPAGCPASTAQGLPWQIDFAHGLRDVNRLAALYHWPGVSGSASVPILAQLQRVVEAPVLRVEFERPGRDDYYGHAAAYDTAFRQRPARPLLRVEFGDVEIGPGLQTLHFDLVRHAGCVWLANLR